VWQGLEKFGNLETFPVFTDFFFDEKYAKTCLQKLSPAVGNSLGTVYSSSDMFLILDSQPS
jgi:hypothetical protein